MAHGNKLLLNLCNDKDRERRLTLKCDVEEMVVKKIKKGFSINTVNNYRENIVHIAASNGCNEILRIILKSARIREKADIKNKFGWTPLMQALRNGHIDTVKFLIGHNFSVNQSTYLGMSTLGIATAIGRSAFELIYRANSNAVHETAKNYINPLCIAAMLNDITLFTILMKLGANVSTANEYTNFMMRCSVHAEIRKSTTPLSTEDFWKDCSDNIEVSSDPGIIEKVEEELESQLSTSGIPNIRVHSPFGSEEASQHLLRASREARSKESSPSLSNQNVSKKLESNESNSFLSNSSVLKNCKLNKEKSTSPINPGVSKKLNLNEPGIYSSDTNMSNKSDTSELGTSSLDSDVSKQSKLNKTNTSLSDLGVLKQSESNEANTSLPDSGVSTMSESKESSDLDKLWSSDPRKRIHLSDQINLMRTNTMGEIIFSFDPEHLYVSDPKRRKFPDPQLLKRLKEQKLKTESFNEFEALSEVDIDKNRMPETLISPTLLYNNVESYHNSPNICFKLLLPTAEQESSKMKKQNKQNAFVDSIDYNYSSTSSSIHRIHRPPKLILQENEDCNVDVSFKAVFNKSLSFSPEFEPIKSPNVPDDEDDDSSAYGEKTPTPPRCKTPPRGVVLTAKQDKMADILRTYQFERYIPLFIQQEVDLDLFYNLTDDDLKDIGIKSTTDRSHLLQAIKAAKIIEECDL